MYLTFFDGLDSLIEYYIPLARDYPVALLIYFLILGVPVIALRFFLRLRRKRKS